MRLLLDTHTLLWWWSDAEELSEAARDLLGDSASELLVSAVSAWEIATKRRSGKLGDLSDASDRFETLVDLHRMVRLPISVAHGLRAGRFEAEHRDPFDRMLAAQSELENLPLVTSDRAFAAFPCETRW